MSITNYSDLQSSVANWLHRADLAALIPDFISLAEAKLSSDIDSRSMEANVTLTTTKGNPKVSVPADMLEMIRLKYCGAYDKPLKYLAPDELTADYGNKRTGEPEVFTVIGADIEIAPIPDVAYSLSLAYMQRIPALSNSNTTNWLLSSWPNAYLYGALCAAQPYLINDARLPVFQALYKEAVEGINSIDWYSGSTMRVKAR